MFILLNLIVYMNIIIIQSINFNLFNLLIEIITK